MKRLHLCRYAAPLAAAALLSCNAADERGTTPGDASTRCSDLEERADALLEAARSCESDADCVLVELDAECIASLLCSVPLSAGADLDRVRNEARALGREATECGGPCSFANCAPPSTLDVHCDATEHQCKHGAAAGEQDGG
jgi:hypothetical protein